jgi:hypothetical protein
VGKQLPPPPERGGKMGITVAFISPLESSKSEDHGERSRMNNEE